MRSLDVANRVKRQFGDESEAQLPNAVILDYINDAQREIVNRVSELLQKKGTVATVIGTKNYALPTDLLRLHRVAFDGNILNPITIQEAEKKYPQKDMSSQPTGVPVDYWIFDEEINLEPIPSTVKNLTIYYQQYPTDVTAIIGTDPTGTLSLPLQYHQRIVDYCIAQAAELDDDDNKYATKMGQLNANLDEMQQDTYHKNQDLYSFISTSAEDSTYYGS